jgi:hypothetical protein
VKGVTIAEALDVSEGMGTEILSLLPEGKIHCFRMVVNALRQAIGEYKDKDPGGLEQNRLGKFDGLLQGLSSDLMTLGVISLNFKMRLPLCSFRNFFASVSFSKGMGSCPIGP